MAPKRARAKFQQQSSSEVPGTARTKQLVMGPQAQSWTKGVKDFEYYGKQIRNFTVFNGKNFRSWRSKMEYLLKREGFLKLGQGEESFPDPIDENHV
jgi:hypothetical protein